MEHGPGEAWSAPLASKACVDDVRALDGRKVGAVFFVQVFSGQSPRGPVWTPWPKTLGSDVKGAQVKRVLTLGAGLPQLRGCVWVCTQAL